MKHEHMISFRLAQVWALFKLAIAFVFSLFYRHKRIWLISERGVDARDNGYWFFRYLKETHPEIEAYYIISADSPDREKLKEWGTDLLDYRSLRHYVMLWRASVLVSTHVQGYFPFVGLGLWVKKVFPAYRKKCHIDLKHGIVKDHMAFLDYSNTQLDLIIAGAKPEYECFIVDHKYPIDHVVLTGLCRYDQLVNTAQHCQLLLMPTWREWLYKEHDFIQSEYVQTYVSLLSNPRLHQLLDQYNMDLVFYPHHEVQKHIEYFKQHCQGKHIIIADKKHYDVQQLLKESDILITDYSSVYFDVAYMEKPVVYYLFDYEQYRSEHYAEGWYDYREGLGIVTYTEEECIAQIEALLQHQCKMPAIYEQRARKLFPYRDRDNCKRVYEAIVKLEKRKISHICEA